MGTQRIAEAGRWSQAGRQALVSGTLASVFSTAVLAWQGYRRYRKPAAPTNATSHWLWGDQDALAASDVSLRHTGVGYATHHASACMWALLYERWLDRGEVPSNGQIIRDAALMTALAAFVDYRLTPRRLRPGFENHLSAGGMLAVFAAFGAGLAAGALINRQHERRLRRVLTLPAGWALARPEAKIRS
ncbi:MAG TPA: hypothetical protein VHK24_07955 [Steroidobacter sp.]|jgi:hypothetical protein|nr:hypothetical protein [Steroidobacter sp.]